MHGDFMAMENFRTGVLFATTTADPFNRTGIPFSLETGNHPMISAVSMWPILYAVLALAAILVTMIAVHVYRMFRYAQRIGKRTNTPTVDSIARITAPTKNEWIAFAIALSLVGALRIPLLVPTEINIDEYYHTTFFTTQGHYGQGLADATVNTGRFVYFLFYWFVDVFCYTTPLGSRTAFVVLGTVAFLATGLLIARYWKITTSIPATTIFLLFFSLHPYTQDNFFFRYGNGVWLFFPLAVLPLLSAGKTFSSILSGGLLLAISFGAYQSFVNVTFSVFVLHVIIEGVREMVKKRSPSYPRLWVRCRVPETLVTMFFGCALYFLLGRIFACFVPEESRSYVFFLTLDRLYDQIPNVVWTWLHLYSPLVSIFSLPLAPLLTIVLVAVLLGLYRQSCRHSSRRTRQRRLLYMMFLLALLGVASYAAPLGALTIVDWERIYPRWVMFVSVFWGGLFAISWTLFPCRSVIGRAILGIYVTILLSYSLFLSQLISDIFQLAQYDRALGQRIVARMEALPKFPEVKKVVFVDGAESMEYERPSRSVRSGYFFSVFVVNDASKVNLLNSVSGYDFAWSLKDEKGFRKKYVNLPVWPAEGSIVIEEDTAIVRLP